MTIYYLIAELIDDMLMKRGANDFIFLKIIKSVLVPVAERKTRELQTVRQKGQQIAEIDLKKK